MLDISRNAVMKPEMVKKYPLLFKLGVDFYGKHNELIWQ
jgi:hypothetical protein